MPKVEKLERELDLSDETDKELTELVPSIQKLVQVAKKELNKKKEV